MLEFLTRSKHGFSQGTKSSWFSSIMGRADSPSTEQMTGMKSWLLADSVGCVSLTYLSPLVSFCRVIEGQLPCPSPGLADHSSTQYGSKPLWMVGYKLYRDKQHFPFWSAWIMANILLFSTGVSLKFIVFCTNWELILQGKEKKKNQDFFFCAHEEDLKEIKAEPMEIQKLVRYAKEMVESKAQKGTRVPSLCFLLVLGWWVPAWTDHLQLRPSGEWEASTYSRVRCCTGKERKKSPRGRCDSKGKVKTIVSERGVGLACQ